MLKHAPMLFLTVAAVLVGVLYFHVIRPFILPLVLAGVVAVLVWPAQRGMIRVCFGHSHIAAFITSLLVVLVVLVPLGVGLLLAAARITRAAADLVQNDDVPAVVGELVADPDAVTDATDTAMQTWWPQLEELFTRQQFSQLQQMAAGAVRDLTRDIYERTVGIVANLISFVVGLAVFLLALYYFLAENKVLLRDLHRLSPLDDEDDEALWETFVLASRGMLLGTVLAAALQAILNGLGFAVAGVEYALMLAFFTFFASLIPFLGSASVWLPVVIYLLFQERWWAAGLLAAYGAFVVSTADNLIRAYALHGQTRIHPLIALVSILGAIRLVGLWGIIVGPVTAVLFHVLLELVNTKLADVLQDEQQATAAGHSS
jgi:predicted PurR-regulated permease PerM